VQLRPWLTAIRDSQSRAIVGWHVGISPQQDAIIASMRIRCVSPTTISLFLNGKRTLRPALAVRLIEGLERAFVRKGSRLDTAFFSDGRTDQ